MFQANPFELKKKNISCFHSVSCFLWLRRQVFQLCVSVEAIVLCKFIRTWRRVKWIRIQKRKKKEVFFESFGDNHLSEFRTFFFFFSSFLLCCLPLFAVVNFKSIENDRSQVCNLCHLPSFGYLCECDFILRLNVIMRKFQSSGNFAKDCVVVYFFIVAEKMAKGHRSHFHSPFGYFDSFNSFTNRGCSQYSIVLIHTQIWFTWK